MVRHLRNSKPTVERLERRLTPSGSNLLVSQSSPALYSDTAGGSLVSVGTSPHLPIISADGRYTVFMSASVNLAAGQIDDNNSTDIFLFDKVANAVELISRQAGSSATAGDGSSIDPCLSADGRYVVFASTSRNLLSGPPLPPVLSENGAQMHNTYLFDRLTSQCKLVSHRFDNNNGVPSYGSDEALISANGAVVVFESFAVDLVSGFPSSGGIIKAPKQHVYGYDVATGAVTLIDHQYGSLSVPGNQSAGAGQITDDGRYVVFNSSAGNLLETSWTSKGDVYRYDRVTGVNDLVSRTSTVAPFGGDNFTIPNGMSPDGRWLTMFSRATNLIPGTTGGVTGQVYLFDLQSGNRYLASHSLTGATSGGNGQSLSAVVSDDGNYVAYYSAATDLVANFVDANGASNSDVLLFDRLSSGVQLVNHKAGEPATSGNGAAYNFRRLGINGDGSRIIYSSLATDLVSGFVDGNTSIQYDVFSFDQPTGLTTLVTANNGSSTKSANIGTQNYWLGQNGNTLVFSSAASDLDAGFQDLNGSEDVFLRDLTTGSTALASRRNDQPSLSPGGKSQWISQSADGRYIAFTSTAPNLVPGQIDAPKSQDVFLLDRETNATTLISRQHGTTATAGNSIFGEYGSAVPAISADGRYVAFCSYSTDLVAGFVDSNGGPPPGTGLYFSTDVYLFDRVTGSIELVSRQAGTTNVGGNLTSGTFTGSLYGLLSISDDGRFVTYMSQATDLIAGMLDNNGNYPTNIGKGGDVYVYDRTTGTNALVSHRPNSSQSTGNDYSAGPQISGDGRYIVYWGLANDVVAGMTGGGRSVFLYDRLANATTLVSHVAGMPNEAGPGGSNGPLISRNGQFVAFQSAANNLVAGQMDANNLDDIFLYEITTGNVELVSHAHDSQVTAGDIFSQINLGLSDDGQFLVYQSGASNLVAGFVDGNGQNTKSPSKMDVFLYDHATKTNVLVSHTFDSLSTSGTSTSGASGQNVSGNGRYVTFFSNASKHVASVTDLTDGNVYLFDRLSSHIKLITYASNEPQIPGNDISRPAILNTNGSAIVFTSEAENLVMGDYNRFEDVFAYVTPPPRVTSVQINDGSAQRSTIRSMTITLDDYVFVDSSPVSVVSGQGQTVGSVQTAIQYQNNTTILTLTFSGANTEFGSLADGKYTLSLNASKISGVGFLDGNGDGVGGDNYVFTFHRLYGDATGDGLVSAADFNAFRMSYGVSSLAFDFNNDGVVTAVDFSQFRLRYGVTI